MDRLDRGVAPNQGMPLHGESAAGSHPVRVSRSAAGRPQEQKTGVFPRGRTQSGRAAAPWQRVREGKLVRHQTAPTLQRGQIPVKSSGCADARRPAASTLHLRSKSAIPPKLFRRVYEATRWVRVRYHGCVELGEFQPKLLRHCFALARL